MPVEKKYLHDIDLVNNRLMNPLLNPMTSTQRIALGGLLTPADQGYTTYDTTLNTIYFWDGAAWTTVTAGSVTWGAITGLVTNQTDLITYLSTNYYPLSSNPAGYITSAALAPYLTTALAATTYVPLTRNLTINGQTYDLSADRSWTVSGLPSQSGNNGKWLTTDGTTASWATLPSTTGTLVALPFTTDHITATGNPYVINDLVYYSGNVYRCIANNDSIIPTNPSYWTNLGAGFPLVQQPGDWNSTSGNNQILNKPTIPVVTPSTLSKVDDTNVTLTLSGSPTTALLAATTLTLGWTGTLADSRITSAATWNAKQDAYTNLSTIGSLANSAGYLYNNGSGVFSYTTPAGGGTVTAVSAGTGMNFTTITGSGSVAIDTAKVPYFSGGLSGTPSASNFLRGDGAWATPTGSGITSLNGETGASQTFAIGTTGTDFGIASASNVHTFNLPIASATNTGKLSSGDWSTFNGKQTAYANLSTIGGLANSAGWLYNNGSGTFSYSTPTKSDIGLGNVENTALSTWAGSTNITTLGTIGTGVWQGTAIADSYISSATTWNAKIGGSGTINEIAYFTASGTIGSLTTGTYPSLTELAFVKGVTSGIQTQLNGKQATGNYITALTGDVTATGPGSVAATIANDAVTFAKMQNISTSKLLGRYSAGSGDVQEITISTGLSLDGSGNLTASGTSQWTTTGTAIYYTTGNVLAGSSTDDGVNRLQVTGDAIVSGVLKETVTLSAQSASYTLAAADRGKLVTMDVATANNLTVPDNTSVPIPTGTKIDVIQIGAGITTILAAGGVTLRSNNSALRLNGQYAACTLIKVATNEWYVIGNLVN